MAAPAVETMVPVKQHGFVVKEVHQPSHGSAPLSPRLHSGAVDHLQPLRLEDGIGGSGSGGGLSLGLLSSLTPQQPASLPHRASGPFGVSPGLPRPGDVHLAEFTHLTPGVKKLMRSVVRGLKAHQDPEAATEGLGGTYFFRNEAGAKIAIMKPCDEEPMAPNNPKGFVGRQLGDPGLKPTVRVGEAAVREVAAYLLDHEHFSKVPHTVMVRMSHPVFHVAGAAASGPTPGSGAEEATEMEGAFSDGGASLEEADLPLKLGSLQEFVPHECDTSELGASRFSVRDVHRIGIMDIRLFNTDRHAGELLLHNIAISCFPCSELPLLHLLLKTRSCSRLAYPTSPAGNILVRRNTSVSSGLADLNKEQYELIPIDHGFALPESLEPPYFEWQHWPQAMMPFSPEELDFIARLDPKADAELLRRELPSLREESLRVLEVSTTLLKRCAAAGLSLSEIATVVTRPLIGLDDEPSQLENICMAAREEVDAEAADARSESDVDGEGYSDLSDVEEADEAQAIAEELLYDGGDGDTSPGADSAYTHFRMPQGEGQPLSSDASRHTASMDDALFSMDDEDEGTGVKTPLPGSPDLPAGLARLKLKAPSLVVRRTGELATPGGVVGVSFGSALASTASASLTESYDSDSPTRPELPGASRGNSIDSMGGTGFPGAATYVPGGFATAMKGAAPRAVGGKTRRRRVGGAGRRTVRAQAYPPLVENRSHAVPASAVFSDLTPAQWDLFMEIVVAKVNAALREGTWAQAPSKGQGPLMSCPKF